MKKLILVSSFMIMFIASHCYAEMTAKEMHETMLYPVIRVNDGGSGTVIYSLPGENGYSTYVLTNHHVINNAIQIVDEWDSALQREIKKEKRGLVYCEIFKYKNLSTPVGTLKVESQIVIYNADEDMALLKLSIEDEVRYIAHLASKDIMDTLYVMDITCAVGCSLALPPIPAWGRITRKNVYFRSLPYHMSSSQIIFGNSGGAMYKILDNMAEFIGIPSQAAIDTTYGTINVVSHMGLFIPWDRICDWLEGEHYEFLFDPSKTEAECLAEREKALDDELKKSD